MFHYYSWALSLEISLLYLGDFIVNFIIMTGLFIGNFIIISGGFHCEFHYSTQALSMQISLF